jgi:ribosome-binding protein aMBF1 (putative translation factor)
MSGQKQIYDFQDWKPVVIRSSQAAKQAKQAKEQKQNAAGTKEFFKLNEDDIPKLDKISSEQSKVLREARNAKGLSQTALAKSLNINVAIIKDYENGTVAKFNKTFYNSLLRKLLQPN